MDMYKKKGYCPSYIYQLTIVPITVYEGPSNSSVMNYSQCERRRYASLILCIYICYSIIHLNVKSQKNRANINTFIGIQSGLSHIHWPLFENEKEESVEIGGVNFPKKVVLC